MPQQPRPMVTLQPAAIPTSTPSAVPMVERNPPSYQETLARLSEAQAQIQPSPKPGTPPNGITQLPKNHIAKRASLDPVSMKENIASYPLMSQLLHELHNGMPSSSISSDDTVGAPVIPPKDYESPQYDTPPDEMVPENGTPTEQQIQNWINMQVPSTRLLLTSLGSFMKKNLGGSTIWKTYMIKQGKGFIFLGGWSG